MRIKKYFGLFLTVFVFFHQGNRLYGQSQLSRIAVFAPLYLDSAFDDAGTYRYGNQFPKYINPGLEFYEGVQLALDSFAKRGDSVEVFVYDTKSTRQTLTQQLDNSESVNTDIILDY